MHKLLNLFCLPLLITGLVFFSNGIIGYNFSNIEGLSNTNVESLSNAKTSSQINNLYSEKEITLKDPPVYE